MRHNTQIIHITQNNIPNSKETQHTKLHTQWRTHYTQLITHYTQFLFPE
jgi:hypothetical protein